MESLIAEWIYYGKYKTKRDFVLEIAIAFYPYLTGFVDFRDSFEKGFWFNPVNNKDMILSKDKTVDMIKKKNIIYDRDFTVDNGKYMFSTKGMHKILSSQTNIYLQNLNYIEYQYKQYLKDLLYVNSSVVFEQM